MKSIKPFLFLILLHFFLTNLKAQNVSTIKVGPENKFEPGENVRKVLGADNEGFYVLSSTRGMGIGMQEKFIITKFDNTSLAKKWAKSFSLNISSEPYEDAFFLKDKIIVLYSTWEKVDKTKTLNIKTISASGEVKDEVAKEVRIKTGMFDFGKRDFYFSFSPDSSKLLAINKFLDKKKPDEVTAVLLDVKEFKKIWEKTIPPLYKVAKVVMHNFKVNNTGDLFYLSTYLSGETPQNTFCIISNSTSAPTFVDLTLQSGRISNSDLFYRIKELNLGNYGIHFIETANEISYAFTANNQIVVIGLFKDFKEGKVGIFKTTIDIKSGRSVASKEQFFDPQVEKRINDIGKEKKITGYNYRINQIINQNGNLLVLADIFKIIGYSNDNVVLTDKFDDLFFNVREDGFGWSGTLPYNSREIGSEKSILHTYSKNNKLYGCTGLPDAAKMQGTLLELFGPHIAELKTQKNDLLFVEFTDNGVKSVSGYASADKKSSVMLVENFLTINGAFLLPMTDFNNMTGSSNAYKFSLLDLK